MEKQNDVDSWIKISLTKYIVTTKIDRQRLENNGAIKKISIFNFNFLENTKITQKINRILTNE